MVIGGNQGCRHFLKSYPMKKKKKSPTNSRVGRKFEKPKTKPRRGTIGADPEDLQ